MVVLSLHNPNASLMRISAALIACMIIGAGCQHESDLLPCEGVQQWLIGPDSSVVLIDYGPHDACFLNHLGSNEPVGAEMKLSAGWYYYSGDPDSYIRELYLYGFDSLEFVLINGWGCLKQMAYGDTVNTSMLLSEYGHLEGGYPGSCPCPLGILYIGIVQTVDGERYAGYVKLRKDYAEGGTQVKVLSVRRSSCPDEGILIDE